MIMSPSCAISSPLSQSQKTVWSLFSKGLSIIKIAAKLNTTRQYINQTRLTAEAKLTTTLLNVAQVNELQIIKLYPKQAILLGYHPALKRKAIITYTTSHGLKVWYWYDNPEEVTDTTFLNQTRQYLIEIAKERGITVENTANLSPAKMANNIFTQLIPELKT
jgi:hypothetical protein